MTAHRTRALPAHFDGRQPLACARSSDERPQKADRVHLAQILQVCAGQADVDYGGEHYATLPSAATDETVLHPSGILPEEQVAAEQIAAGGLGLLRLERGRGTGLQGEQASAKLIAGAKSSPDIRTPAHQFIKDREVEVEPGFSLSQQIGIAVAALTDDGDLPLVELVMKVSCGIPDQGSVPRKQR